jgi:uncharacterized protein involved in exopolysaccharide biosynthesis
MVNAQEFDVKHFGLMLRRRRWLILGTVGGCIVAAILLNLLTQPVYRATTRIEVRKEPNRSALTGEAIASYGYNSDNVALYTAAELITNRALLRDVVEALRGSGNLQLEPPRRTAIRGFFGRLLGQIPVSEQPGVANAADLGSMKSDADVHREIEWLLRITRIRPIPETRLVMIQVDHWVPGVAKAIADTLAHQFVAYEEKKRSSADLTRLAYMNQQIDEVRTRIEHAERTLYSPNQLGLGVLDSKLKQLNDNVSTLNDAHVRVKTDRLAAEARLKLVRAALKDSLMAWDEVPVENENVQTLWRELLTTRTDLARAREVYRGKHPRLMILESQLRSLQDNIRGELRKAVGALESEYALLKGREAALQGSLSQTEGQLSVTSDRHGQHASAESDLKSDRDIYALLMGKAKELEISGEVQEPLVSVVEAAMLAPRPVRPRPALNLVMGVLVGLTSGVGLALVMEFLRRTIKTPKDLTDALHLPVLGMIPKTQT